MCLYKYNSNAKNATIPITKDHHQDTKAISLLQA